MMVERRQEKKNVNDSAKYVKSVKRSVGVKEWMDRYVLNIWRD
jgi:hypothetical protein